MPLKWLILKITQSAATGVSKFQTVIVSDWVIFRIFRSTKSTRFQVPKNGIWGAQTKKPRPLFNVNIPPKWWRALKAYPF